MRSFNSYEYYNELDDLDLFYELYYLDYTRASQQDVNRILGMLSNEESQLFADFQGVIENYFRTAISFTLDNVQGYTGNINQQVNNIYNQFRRRYNSIILSLRASGVPNNVIDQTFRAVIEFALKNTNITPAPIPPPPFPTTRWQMESMGRSWWIFKLFSWRFFFGTKQA